MTPLSVRQQAYHFAETNPEATIPAAFVQGFLFAQQFYDISEDEIVSTPLCHCASPVSEAPTFDEFWQTYNYKKAKPQTQRFWNKLTLSQKLEIMRVLPEYIASTPNKEKRMYPATFINPANERWKDEIIHAQPTEQQQRFAAYAASIQGLNKSGQ